MHTRHGFVWPLGIAMEGLTATTADERENALRRMETTVTPETLFHESVDPADPRRYTRHWFSWADMLYVELVLVSAGLIRG
jgi:meiotically up-regulated gene 157 (Mug157) protein